jgi:ATP-dependent Zn protease
MTRVQMLATSTRPLADVLVDRLRTSGNSLLKLQMQATGDASDQGQYSLNLEDNGETGDLAATRIMRPDDVAVAILLGRALDARRDLLARLQDRDTVAIIEVQDCEHVELVERLVEKHVFGTYASVFDGDALTLTENAAAISGMVALFARRGEEKSKKAAKSGNHEFAAAVQRRCAIFGIACEPDRRLPPNLVLMAKDRFVMGRLDGATIASVIEAITGKHPGPVEDDLAKLTTLEVLNTAIRADLGAERSLARLRQLVRRDHRNAELAPRLSDIHGLGDAKSWGLALVKDLREYTEGWLAWSEVDKGCLLTGAPGTGKTSFARALAREAGVHFIATSYGQWQAYREGHLGHVTQAIRNVFSEAAREAPSIVFIDEIDTLPARGKGKWNDDWFTAIMNVILTCLDGFDRREGVVVIAACNDPSRLDPALVRSGRLDRHIEIPLPDIPALVGIFRTHLGDDLPDVNLRGPALAARGGTGADVERFVRDARRQARLANRQLELADLLAAVRSGEPEWPADVRHRVAYHEAGHAIALLALGIGEPKALSIGGTGGFAESDLGEMRAITRSHLEKFLVVLLAGRAAEQLAFGEATAGAGGSDESDLGRATALATRLETDYGLGTFGLVCIPGGSSGRDLLLLDSLRSAVAGTIDRVYATAQELLASNRHSLEALAVALFDAGYLDRSDINAVLVHSPLATCTVETATVEKALGDAPDDPAIVESLQPSSTVKNQA